MPPRQTLIALALLAGCSGSPPAEEDAAPPPDAALDTRGQAPDARIEAGPPTCLPALPDAGPAPQGCPVAKPAQPDSLDEALALLKLDRCTAGFTEADKTFLPASIWKDPYRFPFFDRVHDAALAAPPFTRTVIGQLDAAVAGKHPVSAALMVAAHHAGHGGEVCLQAAPLEAEPLAEACLRLLKSTGAQPDAAAIRKQAAAVPLELQRAVARIVDAVTAAARDRDDALKGADLAGIPLDFVYYGAPSLALAVKAGHQLNPKQVWVQDLLKGGAAGFDYGLLYRAAVRLALAVEEAALPRFKGAAVSFSLPTPIGRLLLRGPGVDTYDPTDAEVGKEIALLVDTGGDDVYRIPAGANASEKNPVSVLIDLGGADTYGYTPKPLPRDGKRLASDEDGRYVGTAPDKGNGPISLSEISRQGAGRLGIGMLLDLGGEGDQYSSLRMSQGFGALGVGVLHDAGGDDVYRGEAGVQGSGVFGVGLLLDAGGKDSYEAYHHAQGFAYAKGVGVLHDALGDDRFFCDPGRPSAGGDPLYYTPQLPGQGNSSFCQGAGFGRRADADGVYMSGGLGVLRDLAGNDTYVASVFGQGTGYWFGTGLLADAAGNDRYDALWYVQGSDAHFALAVFLDEAGDDLYNSSLEPSSTSIGVGHDFSVGWHLDLGGSDKYRAPNLSLGSGNDNGIGLLLNVGGDDSYQSVGQSTLGAAALGADLATGPRAKVIVLGVFLDVGGVDTYAIDGQPKALEGTSWLFKSPSTTTKQWGVGLDTTGAVSLP